MQVKGKISVKFCKDLLFRKVGNLLAWGTNNLPTAGYETREGKVYSMGMDSRVLNFSVTVVRSTVPLFRGSFGLLVECALRLLSGDLLTSFHLRAEFIAFPLRNLHKPFSE